MASGTFISVTSLGDFIQKSAVLSEEVGGGAVYFGLVGWYASPDEQAASGV